MRARLPVLASLAVRGSVTRWCATAAHSAARSPTTIRSATIRPPRWGWAPTIRTERRSILADEFFRSAFTTALERGELIVSIDFPLTDAAEYVKFPYLVGVFVARLGQRVRVAVTGGAGCVHRVPALEQGARGAF